MKLTARMFVVLFLFGAFCAPSAMANFAVPPAAKEHFKAGVALINRAQKTADLRNALAEFAAAARLAPEWPGIHYNLALVASKIDKPAKAIEEYETYLKLAPNAVDRGSVEGMIEKLKELIATKRKLGIAGVKFAALPEGIAVIELLPGSRMAKSGLRRGDIIIAVGNPKLTSTNGAGSGSTRSHPMTGSVVQQGHTTYRISYPMAKERSADVDSIADFFKAIDYASAHSDPRVQMLSAGRMYSRFSHDTQESGPVLILTIIRGGEKTLVLVKQSMFHSKVIEIEQAEFDTEVLNQSMPVVVTFWSSSCSQCRTLIPTMESDSTRYTGRLKFVNVNVDENKQLASRLGINEVPTVMVFRGGNAESTNSGAFDKRQVENILNSAAR